MLGGLGLGYKRSNTTEVTYIQSSTMVEVLKQAAVGKAESQQDATYCLVASTTYHSQTKYGGGECKNKWKNFFLNKIFLFG